VSRRRASCFSRVANSERRPCTGWSKPLRISSRPWPSWSSSQARVALSFASFQSPSICGATSRDTPMPSACRSFTSASVAFRVWSKILETETNKRPDMRALCHVRPFSSCRTGLPRQACRLIHNPGVFEGGLAPLLITSGHTAVAGGHLGFQQKLSTGGRRTQAGDPLGGFDVEHPGVIEGSYREDVGVVLRLHIFIGCVGGHVVIDLPVPERVAPFIPFDDGQRQLRHEHGGQRI